ncbi:hypothetical protein BH09VER1_BH09VER1_18560 [soil metagenome]
MADASPPIGVIDLKMAGWSAGHSYSLGLASSLHAASASVHFLSKDPPSTGDLPSIKLPAERYFPGEWSFRQTLRLGRKNVLAEAVRQNNISVLGPVLLAEQLVSGTRNIGWIPDLQPLVLRDLYTAAEVKNSAARFQTLLERCDSVIVSSEDSRRVALGLFPGFEGKLAVLPFPSLFAFQPPPATVGDIRQKYGLPDRFFLVANQFWKHKNHLQVVKALACLRARGEPICCVMTGLPADFRDRDNTVLSDLFQQIACGRVGDQCRILGLVPRADLLALLRCATALVQPSRFEGWNTTVQDALALGCPLLLSDLPVHREQAPQAAGFFALDDPESLATLMAAHIDSLPLRPQADVEENALAAQREFARAHGLHARRIFEGSDHE